MKKLILIPIMLFTLVFVILFTNNDVYAVEIDTDLRFNKVLYQQYKYDSDTNLDYFDIYLQVDDDNAYVRNLTNVSLGLMNNNNFETFIYVLNPNYYIELYRGSGNNRVQYDSIGHVSLIYAIYEGADYEFTFYDTNHEIITSIKPFDLEYDDLFLHTSYINQSATVDKAFESGREQGYIDGVRAGDREGYERGLQRGRELFGYYDEVNDVYIPADNWGVTEYNRGLNEGLQSTEGEAYNQGFIDGSNESFLSSIKDWIVPAIIIVLFLGGAISIVMRKREV